MDPRLDQSNVIETITDQQSGLSLKLHQYVEDGVLHQYIEPSFDMGLMPSGEVAFFPNKD